MSNLTRGRVRKASGTNEEEDEVNDGRVLQRKWQGEIPRFLMGVRLQCPELRTGEMTLLPSYEI